MPRELQAYTSERFGQKPTFASFLPGIAGQKGIPIWCYYVNRGQGVVSFGVNNKDHAIMEFLPAHKAFASVKRSGFRTFLRRDGIFTEAFTREALGKMVIGMNTLDISEEDPNTGLRTEVSYFVLPEERLGALIRQLKITNLSDRPCTLQVLDGMPELIPYGVPDISMKNMTQTAKAWMQVEDAEKRTPYYRVRVSMGDTAQVGKIEGGNFALGFDAWGSLLPVVADMGAIFSYDTSLEQPHVFMEGGLDAVLNGRQHSSNLLPGAFFALERSLEPGESLSVTEMIGQVERRELLNTFLAQAHDGAYFAAKQARAVELTKELTDRIATETGDPAFDAYCRYTYMDNVLRGGQPIQLGNNKTFYVYSRKHGDLERDYNYFSMLPEFYSQGNGNFRDVNQNRRCDPFFSPFVGRENIRTFYDLIQLDGYNPLSVEMKTYTIPMDQAASLIKPLGDGAAVLSELLSGPFTPGRLYSLLLDLTGNAQAEYLFRSIMNAADCSLNARFGEGYWSDHWTYNLDLIEEYLTVFPEQERSLLYSPEYTYFVSQACIAPRAKRYAETGNGIRQYHALDEQSLRATAQPYLHDHNGKLVCSTLIEKLALLCAVKFSALDPYGMGIEMEGGKPGWYDALNGLPGLLGSSMCESYELARMLDYTVGALERNPGSVELLEEISRYLDAVSTINERCHDEIFTEGEIPDFWNAINDAKEAYRAAVYAGVSGRRVMRSTAQMARQLSDLGRTVNYGIEKALSYGCAGDRTVAPAYFAYDVTDYSKDAQGIHPRHFRVVPQPAFLEGPVRWLKLSTAAANKKVQYARVRSSGLYDTKLSMYRVNASLEDASYELGRCKAFTPGWLENGSIWLHMEYKYLLELLRCGLYPEFFRDFHAAGVPFLDPEAYGRSTLENSSFLVSSLNPNEDIHGRGFVARLSGSTAEFLSIWRRMFFGEKPFCLEGGVLTFAPQPAIPAYLIGEDRTVKASFLGRIPVTYRLSDCGDFIPGSYHVASIRACYADGREISVCHSTLRGDPAQDLRSGAISALEIRLVH